jgi:hypothetical protein
VALLLAARLALIAIPFPRLASRLGTLVAPGDARVAQLTTPHSRHKARFAREVGWAVTRAARYVPFNAVCLPQAMAARFMLKRRGIASVLHFSAGKYRESPLDTHAWLDSAGIAVTGYPVPKELAEVGCFI